MELESICRVCLKQGSSGGKLKSIFCLEKKEGGHVVSCPEMLVQCASVTIAKDDGYPCHMCNHCFRKLWSAYKFRHLCEKSFEYLKDCVFDRKSDVEIKVEKKEENLINSLSNKLDHGDENKECVNVTLLEKVKIEVENENDDYIYDVGNADTEVEDEDTDSYNVKDAEEFEDNHEEDIIEKQTRKKKRKHTKPIKSGENLKEKSRKKKIEKWKCSLCPRTFRFQYLLLSHEDAHVGVKRYFCNICQKAYRSEKDHKKQHKYSLKYKCETCSKCFNARSKLALHIVVHDTDRKKLVCGLNGCTKEFLSQVGLQRHKNLHDGVRTMMCHLCSKTFLDKYTLEAHIRMHNNEKNYKCSYCDKRFYLSSKKTLHEKIHTNIRNHKCTNCEQKFYCSSSLKRHLTTHTKILKEECRFCGKRFSRRDNRRRHEAVMHGVTEDKQEKVNAFKLNAPELT